MTDEPGETSSSDRSCHPRCRWRQSKFALLKFGTRSDERGMNPSGATIVSGYMRLSFVVAAVTVCGLSSPAVAQSARCGDAKLEGFVDGTSDFVRGGMLCSPVNVKRSTRAGRPTCRALDGAKPALTELAPSEDLVVTLRRDNKNSRRSTVVVRANDQTVLTWSADEEIDCLGRAFLSSDRRTVLIEHTVSRTTHMELDELELTAAFRLSQPAPRKRVKRV